MTETTDVKATTDDSRIDETTKAKAKVTTDEKGGSKPEQTKNKNKTEKKAKKDKTEKKVTKDKNKKKVMKSKTEKKATKDVKAIRIFCNKVLTSPIGRKAGLVLVENAHGAIQVKREDGLMFSFRKTGRGCIITHPIYKGKGQNKERWRKHSGTKWDHLTDCQWDEVSIKMLTDRVKDKRSAKDYFEEFYKGKKKEKSGLFLKAEAAKKRIAKADSDNKKATNKKKREKAKTKKASNVVKRQSKKTTPKKTAVKKTSTVITKVAESIS